MLKVHSPQSRSSWGSLTTRSPNPPTPTSTPALILAMTTPIGTSAPRSANLKSEQISTKRKISPNVAPTSPCKTASRRNRGFCNPTTTPSPKPSPSSRPTSRRFRIRLNSEADFGSSTLPPYSDISSIIPPPQRKRYEAPSTDWPTKPSSNRRKMTSQQKP